MTGTASVWEGLGDRQWFDVAINHDGTVYVDGNRCDALPKGDPVTDCYRIGGSAIRRH
jgi:hypothetical protein